MLRLSFNNAPSVALGKGDPREQFDAVRLNEIARELADMFGVRIEIEIRAYIVASQSPIREVNYR